MSRRDGQNFGTRVVTNWDGALFGLTCRGNEKELSYCVSRLTNDDNSWMGIENIGGYDGRC